MSTDYLTLLCGSLPKLANRSVSTTNIGVLTAVGAVSYVAYGVYKSDPSNYEDFVPSRAGPEATICKNVLTAIKSKITTGYETIKLKMMIYYYQCTGQYNINVVSSIIESKIERPASDMRQIFLNMNDTFRTFPMRSAAIHSHPESAVTRSAMASFMANVAATTGLQPYHVSRSRSDEFLGSRYFYNPKDLAMQYQNDTVPRDVVIIMTDVDYYANINAWLMLWRPILIYTFVPTQLSGQHDEYSYHFEGDEVEYHVRGGATYKHQLWVYDGDTVVVDNGDERCTFNIEQRMVPDDANHRYICLTPASRIKYPYAQLTPINNKIGIQRFKNNGFLYDSITDQLSIAVSSKHHAVNLTGQVYEAIKERMANKTAPPIIADVERILRDSQIENSHLKAPLLFNHLQTKIDRNVILTSSMVSYHPLPEGALTNEDGAPMGENATSNLVYPGAAYPTNSHASDLSTIHGRITRVSNNRTPPSRYNTYANEYLSQLIHHQGRGVPWQPSEVVQAQDGTMQKARNTAILHTVSHNPTNALKSFIKAEAYSTANEPRNITTMTPQLTLMMSAFTYAFKHDILKQQPFYSPGLNPEEIVERLKELTTETGVVCTDYNRFDGSISEWLQKHVVGAAYRRWLSQQHIGSFNEWFNQIFIQKATTRSGVTYHPGWGTRSGSPITTDGNTMINAFIMYVAHRKLGYNVRRAYTSLGLYCGDDGYTPNAPGLMPAIVEVATELGLSVDCNLHTQGPYPFCGRLFINPRLIPDSFQDLKRTLPKLHLVSRGSESLEQRITNKATGYAVTDSKTPILSVWAKKLLSLTGLEAKHVTHEEAYKMTHPWPQANVEALLEGVMAQLDMTSQEIKQIEEMINQTTSLTAFPVIAEWTPDSKITAVRGDIIEEPSRNHNSNQNASRQARTSRTRNQATSGASRPAHAQQATSNDQQRTGVVVPPLVGGRGIRSGQPNSGPSQPPSQIHSEAASRRFART